MGGKGVRRREKNYRAAHGGYSLLPPPPKSTDLDAIPSKLRRIMDFTSDTRTDSKDFNNGKKRKRDAVGVGEQTKPNPKDKGGKAGQTDEKLITPRNETDNDDTGDKKKSKGNKKKKKKHQVTDLRFDDTTAGHASGNLKRKERKKKYLEAKKNKHKKSRTDESLDFPGHEKIKFGDVVKAPPKLSTVPKRSKTFQDASHERLRLQAVEAYRNRKGTGSRLGIQLPPITPDLSV